MNTNMHGKPIAKLIFSAWSSYQIREERSGGNVQFELSATYHGDHDEFWVVKKIDGKEVARYNPKLIETIEWAPQETSDGTARPCQVCQRIHPDHAPTCTYYV